VASKRTGEVVGTHATKPIAKAKAGAATKRSRGGAAKSQGAGSLAVQRKEAGGVAKAAAVGGLQAERLPPALPIPIASFTF
jgi:hypothetical protein